MKKINCLGSRECSHIKIYMESKERFQMAIELRFDGCFEPTDRIQFAMFSVALDFRALTVLNLEYVATDFRP